MATSTTHHILRRHDVHLLPFLALLFLLNSLDRSNIGNAETGGFTRYAGLSPGDLNDAVTAFFIAFVALQPVGAALGKRVGVGRWVGGVMIGWGILTFLTAFVHSRTQLIFLRVCIGALEAGFYPATVFYLGLFYTRYEFAQRLGIFYGQYAVAGAFGGLVSYVVFSIFPPGEGEGEEEGEGDGRSWHSYQILFVLEGLFTIAVAVTTLLWLPAGPGSAWWLTPEERLVAEKRVLSDRRAAAPSASYSSRSSSSDDNDDDDDEESSPSLHRRSHRPSHPLLSKPTRRPPSSSSATGAEASLTRADVFLAFTDLKIWVLLLLNILSALPATAFSIFLPLVLQGLGHTALASNALTIPPFLLGAVTLWGTTYISDRRRQRLPFILFALGLNMIGLLAALWFPATAAWAGPRYAALCILLAGSFIASPLTVAWISGNILSPGKRAVALGINGWGNLAGVIAARLFAPTYAPSYEVPLMITAAAVTVSFAGYAAFWVWVSRENAWRRRWTAELEEGVQEQKVVGLRRWLWERTGGKGPLVLMGEESWAVEYGY